MRKCSTVLFICILAGLFVFTTGAQDQQTSKMAPTCPTGGKEAEAIHLKARQYRLGAKGMPRDTARAEQLFEEALDMGNARSALHLGEMYFIDYAGKYPAANRKKYMIIMYNQSLKMGCPDAYVVLAKCYENGWGVRQSQKKTIELLKKGAKAGSPKGMEFYGEYLIREKGKIVEGRQWLRRALDIGNGEAAIPLARTYFSEENAEAVIESLRAGARQGCKECLLRLELVYKRGYYGQMKNMKHAACYGRLRAAIDDFDAPAPIAGFDDLCPRPPIMPFQKHWEP